MPKQKSQKTTLHEIVVSFTGFEKRLIRSAEREEAERIAAVMESDDDKPRDFYGMDLPDGLECYINLKHISRINILDSLPGIEIEKAPRLESASENREDSDDPVTLRFWLADNASQETHGEVDYQEWSSIRFALEEETQHFIGFTDEDGERVIFPLSGVAAIEVFDSHYLNEEQLGRFLSSEKEAEKNDA